MCADIFFSPHRQPPKPEDLSIVCFTSGTTGDHLVLCGIDFHQRGGRILLDVWIVSS